MEESAIPQDIKARIAAARQRLEEKKAENVGDSHGPSFSSNSKARASSKATGRDSRRNDETSKDFRGGSSPVSGPFRPDDGPLGPVGDAPGSGSKNGSRAKGESGGSTQASRQNAGKETLRDVRDDYFSRIEHQVKRALIYAGFDLKGDAQALSEDEVTKLKPKVAVFFQRVGIGLDWTLTHANKDRAESDVWMLEDDEADFLALVYLKRARKIGWMAQVARQVQHIEDAGDGIKVARILGKRVIASGLFIQSNGGFEPWIKRS